MVVKVKGTVAAIEHLLSTRFVVLGNNNSNTATNSTLVRASSYRIPRTVDGSISAIFGQPCMHAEEEREI